ncbi:MAG TPA: hypothetical protein VEH27_03945 [Methylomirabilota bacterium]|nr:hypothetical protein [Methylomirabilota bacterium]
MNLLKSRPIISAYQFNPETVDYRDRLVAAGGTISDSSLKAIEKFVRDCKNDLIWDKLLEVGPFAGDNLTAALVKLKHQGQSALTNVNFISGDYQERGSNGGLLGNASTKYLNTGMNAQSLPDNGHLSFYLREDVVSAGNRVLLGARVTTDQYWLGSQIPASEIRALYGGTVSTLQGSAITKGFYLCSRLSSTNFALYRDGGLLNATSSAVVHAKPNADILVFGYTTNGSPGAHLGSRGSFYSIGHGLTASESQALASAVQTLQLNLNRAI